MPHKISFRVVHCSGEDPNYESSQLNKHGPLVQGWQSSRFCLFPQDVVLMFDRRTRLHKVQILSHQSLIASKVEFFVGDVPNEQPLQLENVRYTRLGYTCLSTNEKTGFKARELKSVHVDAEGICLKLVIHKNHVNKLNVYNQVGVVAVNIIGDDVTGNHPDLGGDKGDERYFSLAENNPLSAVLNRPDYISPVDDLAFDMYQDPEVADVIRRLEKRKNEAVLGEQFEFAKKIKDLIRDLQKLGEKLGKMEVEKRLAIEGEDYERAQARKTQMQEIRDDIFLRLQQHGLSDLKDDSKQADSRDAAHSPTPRRGADSVPPARTPYDDRVVGNRSPSRNADPESATADDALTEADKEATPMPTGALSPTEEAAEAEGEEPRAASADPDKDANVPEEMNEKDRREAADAIDDLSIELVTKAYSKNYRFREEALDALLKAAQQPASGDPHRVLRSLSFLLKRALKDNVQSIFSKALDMHQQVVVAFLPNNKLDKKDTAHFLDDTLPLVIFKTGDSSHRMRTSAYKYTMDLALLPEVKGLHRVPKICCDPLKYSTPQRLAQSRAEMVEELVTSLGLGEGAMTVEVIMPFCVSALDHSSAGAREIAARIAIEMYKKFGSPIRKYLPPSDDIKTKKNIKYRNIMRAFDKIDGKLSDDELRTQEDADERQKQAEVNALKEQVNQLKKLAGENEPSPVPQNKKTRAQAAPPAKKDVSRIKKENKADSVKSTPRAQKPAKATPQPTKQKSKKELTPRRSDEAPSVAAHSEAGKTEEEERTCVFCAEKNDEFGQERALNMHYLKKCPMLTKCNNCKIVVEIADLSMHLLTQCSSKDDYEQCGECSESILKAEHETHPEQCIPTKPNSVRCPLCHEDLSPDEDSWKKHLMSAEGCKGNPRTNLKAAKPAAKSSIPVPKSKQKKP